MDEPCYFQIFARSNIILLKAFNANRITFETWKCLTNYRQTIGTIADPPPVRRVGMKIGIPWNTFPSKR